MNSAKSFVPGIHYKKSFVKLLILHLTVANLRYSQNRIQHAIKDGYKESKLTTILPPNMTLINYNKNTM